MKKAISACIAAALLLTPAAFAADNKTPGKAAPVKPPAVTVAPSMNYLKTYAPQLANNDFSKATLHTAKQIDPYTFALNPADFATEKWAQYVTAVYVQATDIHYCVSTLYADGNLKQQVVFKTQDIEQHMAEAKINNEALRKLALDKPIQSFTVNYKDIYLAPWQLIDEKELVDYKQITEKVLNTDASDSKVDLTQSYKLYKKGKSYVLVLSQASNGTLNGMSSPNLKALDDAMGVILSNNNVLLK